MDGPVPEEEASKMLGLSFFSKLDWGSYIISVAKTASRKIGATIHSMKFISHKVRMYLYKSTILLCMEYYRYVSAIAMQDCWSFTCCLSYHCQRKTLLSHVTYNQTHKASTIGLDVKLLLS